MPAHAVAKNTACRSAWEILLNQVRQLAYDVVFHPKMRGPRRLRRIEVKTRALPQIICLVIGNMLATRTGVGGDDDDFVLGGVLLRARFGDEVLFCTRQS